MTQQMKLLKQLLEMMRAHYPSLKRGVNENLYAEQFCNHRQTDFLRALSFLINPQLQLGVNRSDESLKPF